MAVDELLIHMDEALKEAETVAEEVVDFSADALKETADAVATGMNPFYVVMNRKMALSALVATAVAVVYPYPSYISTAVKTGLMNLISNIKPDMDVNVAYRLSSFGTAVAGALTNYFAYEMAKRKLYLPAGFVAVVGTYMIVDGLSNVFFG